MKNFISTFILVVVIQAAISHPGRHPVDAAQKKHVADQVEDVNNLDIKRVVTRGVNTKLVDQEEFQVKFTAFDKDVQLNLKKPGKADDSLLLPKRSILKQSSEQHKAFSPEASHLVLRQWTNHF